MANQQQKIVIIGDAGVGKTSLIDRILHNNFKERYVPTLGCDVVDFVRGNIVYSLWDTAGDERFKGLADGYLLSANRAVIVVDGTTNQERINFYKQKMLRLCGPIQVIIVVNKAEMDETREKFQDIRQDVVFVSCKNNMGIQQFINKL